MKELIGKTIKRVLISPNDEILVFDTDAGIIVYETEGDCCSSTWFENITRVEALLEHRIIGCEYIDLPAPNEGREYKNDGYYGGGIDLVTSGLDISGFKEITDDWTA